MTNKKIVALKEERVKLLKEQRRFLDELEERDRTQEDSNKLAAMDAEFDRLDDAILEEEKYLARSLEIEGQEERELKPEREDVVPGAEKNGSRAFDKYLTSGRMNMNEAELRALQADSDDDGGYIVAPEQFVSELIKDIDNQVYMRQISRTMMVTNAASLGAPALDTDPSDPTWTAEIETGSDDSTMKLGKRSLTPHPLAKRIQVSRKLLRIATMGAEAMVRERLAYVFATTQENAFLNGSGANQPLGVFTASDEGISTSRDVSDGNTSTAITADGLINAKYSLKAGYMQNGRWIFHRDSIKEIRKLKDGEGQYLWKAGLSDRSDTLLELPVVMSEYAPNTFTSGQYVGIVGDFRYYWIVDALGMEIQRLVELYAETNQVGFIGRMESDGMPVLENAFARVTLA